MLSENFVLLGVLFNIIGGISYLIDTIKGKTQPNKVTWFLWALAPLIAFSAEINHGVGLQSLMTFMVGFNPLLIFLASFINKKSKWKITSFDLICGGLSLLGLFFWYLTSNGYIAIIFSILADALAGAPTIVKAYKAPETESSIVFLFGAISAGITLLTIKQWDLPHYGFPLYIFVICALLFILIKFKVGNLLKHS